MTDFDTLWYMHLTGIIGTREYLRRRYPSPEPVPDDYEPPTNEHWQNLVREMIGECDE